MILPILKNRTPAKRPMAPGAERGLTYGEWASLTPGLAEALRWAGATPRIANRAALGARVARLWRGSVPILTQGAAINWQGALEDFSAPGGEKAMATLQHELQHVLDFATGELTALGYVINVRNWRYAYRLQPDSRWRDFGAEQRASIAEHLWLMERGLWRGEAPLSVYLKLVPWANPALGR